MSKEKEEEKRYILYRVVKGRFGMKLELARDDLNLTDALRLMKSDKSLILELQWVWNKRR